MASGTCPRYIHQGFTIDSRWNWYRYTIIKLTNMGEKYVQELDPGSGSIKLFLLGGFQPPRPPGGWPAAPRAPLHTERLHLSGSPWILVPRSWYRDLGTRILVPRSWYQDLGTKIQDPGTGFIKNYFFVGPLEFTKELFGLAVWHCQGVSARKSGTKFLKICFHYVPTS